MFVAFDHKGNSINVAEKRWSSERLRKLREEAVFICPTCQNEVELKIGSIISAHFAHKKSSDCPTVKGSAETQYHMKGKIDLFKWLQTQKGVHNVQLEPFLPNIKQRPDLLIEYDQKRLAVEYQCSSMSVTLLQKRSQMYKEVELSFLWILGAKSIKRKGASLFQISPFQWRFVLKKEDGLIMYHYCSELESFILLQNMIPFSTRTVFADPTNHSIHSSSFAQLLTPPLQKINYLKDWFNKVKAFRLQPLVFKTKQVSSLHNFLYKNKQIPLSYLPSYAFLPLPTNFLIESPVYVWQGWVIFLLDRIPLNSKFTSQLVMNDIHYKVKQGLISVRSLPQIEEHYSIAIKDYLEKLSELSVIKQVSKHVFLKVTSFEWSTHIEELLSQDLEVMQVMTKMMNRTIRE